MLVRLMQRLNKLFWRIQSTGKIRTFNLQSTGQNWGLEKVMPKRRLIDNCIIPRKISNKTHFQMGGIIRKCIDRQNSNKANVSADATENTALLSDQVGRVRSSTSQQFWDQSHIDQVEADRSSTSQQTSDQSHTDQVEAVRSSTSQQTSDQSHIDKVGRVRSSTSQQTSDISQADHTEKEVHACNDSTSELQDGTCKDLTDKKSRKNKGNEEKASKPRPNYFVAVQMTNPKIHFGLAQVQQAVLSSESRMKEIMIALPTLHLTLLVTCLHGQEDITRAIEALDECGKELRDRFKDGYPTFEVAGMGTFRNQVVFAKITPGNGLNEITHIHDVVGRQMVKHGVVATDEASLIPHITVMKMSKAKPRFRKKVAKKIDPGLYKEFKDMTFGTEVVTSLQLCSMQKPKDAFGYYHVAHKVHLGQGDYTLNEFSRSMVQSALVSALETMKKDYNK